VLVGDHCRDLLEERKMVTPALDKLVSSGCSGQLTVPVGTGKDALLLNILRAEAYHSRDLPLDRPFHVPELLDTGLIVSLFSNSEHAVREGRALSGSSAFPHVASAHAYDAKTGLQAPLAFLDATSAEARVAIVHVESGQQEEVAVWLEQNVQGALAAQGTRPDLLVCALLGTGVQEGMQEEGWGPDRHPQLKALLPRQSADLLCNGFVTG
jgi:hypothetical protein